MATPPLNGSLEAWPDLAARFSKAALLCGNGLSINVWPAFAYGSLFDQAHDGRLTDEDLALFAETENFERVLSDLNTAIRVNETLGQPVERIYMRYRSIQRGLGHAVRAVHLIRSQIPDATLKSIRDELLRYDWIFSTSYDLLLYWAMGCGGSFTPFIDHFRGHRLEFDPDRADVRVGEIPVYFLHGALHLVVSGSGVTWKLRRGEIQSVLDKFGEPIQDDPQARPLLVTEGTARDKLRAIDGNVYLAHSLPSMSIRSARSLFRCSQRRDGPSPGDRRTFTLAWKQTSCGFSTRRRTRSGIHRSVLLGQMGSNHDRRFPFAARRRSPSAGSPKMMGESITRSASDGH